MRLVVQRVSQASVEIKGSVCARIGPGLLVFLGIHRDNTLDDISKWVDKLLKLRIFPDAEKPINQSVTDVDGEILLVSQFTLYGDTKGQNRPSFIQAAAPELAKNIYEAFVKEMKEKWPKTQTGEFAADMKVALTNDGPVTILLGD